MLMFIKDVKKLVKFNEYGVYAVYCYVILIFYTFLSNFEGIKEHKDDVKMFSWKIGDLAGTSALAFTIHATFPPVIKCNKNQAKNT